jgi:hypothetical protein
MASYNLKNGAGVENIDALIGKYVLFLETYPIGMNISDQFSEIYLVLEKKDRSLLMKRPDKYYIPDEKRYDYSIEKAQKHNDGKIVTSRAEDCLFKPYALTKLAVAFDTLEEANEFDRFLHAKQLETKAFISNMNSEIFSKIGDRKPAQETASEEPKL